MVLAPADRRGWSLEASEGDKCSLGGCRGPLVSRLRAVPTGWEGGKRGSAGRVNGNAERPKALRKATNWPRVAVAGLEGKWKGPCGPAVACEIGAARAPWPMADTLPKSSD